MLKIKELINNIGDFEFDVDNDKVCFAGVLLDKEKVVLRGRIAAEFVSLIGNYDAYCVRGKVDGIAVTLIDSIIINIEERIGEQYAYFTFRPAEVVLGRSYNAEAKVTKMWMTTQTLNWMFSELPLKARSYFTRENPSILEYTYPDELCAEDKFGKLRIYQSFGMTFDRHGVHHEIHTVVEYLFNEPVEIKEALGKLAAARNLFTFFANHYLPFLCVVLLCTGVPIFVQASLISSIKNFGVLIDGYQLQRKIKCDRRVYLGRILLVGKTIVIPPFQWTKWSKVILKLLRSIRAHYSLWPSTAKKTVHSRCETEMLLHKQRIVERHWHQVLCSPINGRTNHRATKLKSINNRSEGLPFAGKPSLNYCICNYKSSVLKVE